MYLFRLNLCIIMYDEPQKAKHNWTRPKQKKSNACQSDVFVSIVPQDPLLLSLLWPNTQKRSSQKGRGVLNWKVQDHEPLVTWHPLSGSRGRNAGAQLTVLHTFMMGLFLKFLGCMPSHRSSGVCFHVDFKSSWADGEGQGTLYSV